jgi:5-hydroxyisourate hydrolase-like protein (transthyretin family)
MHLPNKVVIHILEYLRGDLFYKKKVRAYRCKGEKETHVQHVQTPADKRLYVLRGTRKNISKGKLPLGGTHYSKQLSY